MQYLNAYEHVFPVVGGRASEKRRRFDTVQVYGTAFPIGGCLWMTASHVLDNAREQPHVGVHHWVEGRGIICLIEESESHPSRDVAVFSTQAHAKQELSWISRSLPLGENVLSVGFPFALDPVSKRISIRLFTGPISGSGPTSLLKGEPEAYELQFPCPRGLSGAPLLLKSEPYQVAGMVLGNLETKMRIFSQEEVISEERTHTLEQFETLRLGLAVKSCDLLALEFALLGGGLERHLSANGLLYDRRQSCP